MGLHLRRNEGLPCSPAGYSPDPVLRPQATCDCFNPLPAGQRCRQAALPALRCSGGTLSPGYVQPCVPRCNAARVVLVLLVPSTGCHLGAHHRAAAEGLGAHRGRKGGDGAAGGMLGWRGGHSPKSSTSEGGISAPRAPPAWWRWSFSSLTPFWDEGPLDEGVVLSPSGAASCTWG